MTFRPPTDGLHRLGEKVEWLRATFRPLTDGLHRLGEKVEWLRATLALSPDEDQGPVSRP